MIWTVLGPLGAQVGETLHLSPDQKGLMVAVPILSGAFLRILLGLLVDRIGSKRTGLIAQAIVICGLLGAWIAGLPSLTATILLGLVLGFAGASFAVALPQAGRWYPPSMQGVVMGIAGAGNMGVVLRRLRRLSQQLRDLLQERVCIDAGASRRHRRALHFRRCFASATRRSPR
jgi:NNP family nitrate/nitrite transporter-like MFS transporter